MSTDVEMNSHPEAAPASANAGNGSDSAPVQAAPEPVPAAPAEPSPAPSEAPRPVAAAAAEAPRPSAAAVTASPKPQRGPFRRFVRSLISHVVFSAVVTATVVGYLYHVEIFNRLGDTFCTEDRLGGYMTKAFRPSALQPGLEKTAASVPAATSSPVAPVAAVTPSAPAAAVSASAPATHTEEPAEAAPAKPALTAKNVEALKSGPAPELALAEPAHQAAPEPAVIPASAAPADAVSVPAPAPAVSESAVIHTAAVPVKSASPAPVSADMMLSEWQAARQAVAGHQEDAADLYRELVVKHPDIADLRGEFGNVLYSAGRTKEAAEQYYEAALLQLKGQQPELAACLVDVIARLDPARAGMLRAQAAQPCPNRAAR